MEQRPTEAGAAVSKSARRANATYRSSSWLHVVEDGDRVVLFHRLTLHLLVGDRECLELIRYLAEPRTLKQCRGRFPAADVASAFRVLRRLGLIVPASSNERADLDAVRQAIRSQRSVERFGRRVHTVRLVLTEKCNLRCDYCFVTANADKLRDGDRDDIFVGLEAIVRENRGEDVQLQFFGGEPTMRFGLIQEIVAWMRGRVASGELRGVGFSMTTNGTLIDDEMAAFFARERFEISLSVDGWETLNDRHRIYLNGRGSFRQTRRGLDLLHRNGAEVAALITITPSNVDRLPELCAFIVRDLEIPSITVNTPQPGPAGWQVDGDRLAVAVLAARDVCEELGAHLSTAADGIVSAIATRRPQFTPCVSEQGAMVALAPGGTISGCKVDWTVPEATQSVRDPLVSDRIVAWKLDDPHQAPDCASCVAVATCGGPCPLEALHFRRTGRLDVEGHCAFYRRITEWAIRERARNATS